MSVDVVRNFLSEILTRDKVSRVADQQRVPPARHLDVACGEEAERVARDLGGGGAVLRAPVPAHHPALHPDLVDAAGVETVAHRVGPARETAKCTEQFGGTRELRRCTCSRQSSPRPRSPPPCTGPGSPGC